MTPPSKPPPWGLTPEPNPLASTRLEFGPPAPRSPLASAELTLLWGTEGPDTRRDSWVQRANAETVPPLRLRNDDWLLAHDPEFDGVRERHTVQVRRSHAWLAGVAAIGFFLLGLVSTRFLLRDERIVAAVSDTTARVSSWVRLLEHERAGELASPRAERTASAER